jgi:hypothetical protein
MKAKKQKIVICGDNHGKKGDPAVIKEFLRFVKEFNPQHRVHLGDCFDLASIRQGALGKEQAESMDEDIKKGIEFIKAYKPTVFLYGNHEDRIDHIIETSTNGIIVDYCIDLKNRIHEALRSVGCKVILPYHADLGVYRIGPISCVHGYTYGKSAVEEQALHYASVGGCCCMGHIHRIEMVCAKKHGGSVGFSGGCLCDKSDMSYAKNRLATAKWGSGWLYGYVQGQKNYKLWQAHKVDREWIYSHKDL